MEGVSDFVECLNPFKIISPFLLNHFRLTPSIPLFTLEACLAAIVLTPEQRAEISRRNGAKSQGPTSAAGKERVSRNAIKHGLASHKHIVLDDEMPQAYDELLQAHLNLFDPRNEVEEELVHRMAEATWRMRRAGCMDTAVLNCSRADAEAIAEEHYGEPGLQEIAYLALKESRAEIDSLHRYDMRAMRAYDRALANLVQIRKLFPLAPVEPEPGPRPGFATPDVPRVPPPPNKPEEHATPPQPASAANDRPSSDVGSPNHAQPARSPGTAPSGVK